MEDDTIMYARDWSRDGKIIVFEKFKSSKARQRDIWVLPVEDGGKAFPYLTGTFDECQPVLSPNGRWMAYVSNESGGYEVVVQAFPNPALGKFIISTRGGMFPRWRSDGRELYYMDPSQQMVAVSVTTDGSFSASKGTPLFKTGLSYPEGAS